MMKANLVLFSKTESEYPDTKSMRPISVLPSILKLFELSISNNFIEAMKSSIFSEY